MYKKPAERDYGVSNKILMGRGSTHTAAGIDFSLVQLVMVKVSYFYNMLKKHCKSADPLCGQGPLEVWARDLNKKCSSFPHS